MPQIFHRSTNILSRVSIFGAVIFAGCLLGLVGALDRSSYATGAFVALTIAVVKATVVVLYFMHVRYSSRLTQVIVAAGVLWLIIMLTFTMADYMTRGWDSGAP